MTSGGGDGTEPFASRADLRAANDEAEVDELGLGLGAAGKMDAVGSGVELGLTDEASCDGGSGGAGEEMDGRRTGEVEEVAVAGLTG